MGTRGGFRRWAPRASAKRVAARARRTALCSARSAVLVAPFATQASDRLSLTSPPLLTTQRAETPRNVRSCAGIGEADEGSGAMTVRGDNKDAIIFTSRAPSV